MHTKHFDEIEAYMSKCMEDSAHDRDHIYRVLYTALDIANHEKYVDIDVLIVACLLHDIGRKEQFENPSVCHAEVGGEKAFCWLLEHGYANDMAQAVRHCIQSHRFRTDRQPESIEAKILFDSDKLDATGTLGIARSLFYKGQVSEPLYSLDQDGYVMDGSGHEPPSFFQEYHFKLGKLYDRFYTKRGSELANARRKSAVDFYESMLAEVSSCHRTGKVILNENLTNH